MNYSGIAAVDALDALNTKDDFEPSIDVDTVALDATEDAIDAATELLASLERLRIHLAAGHDVAEAEGLKVEVALAAERVAAITAAGIA